MKNENLTLFIPFIILLTLLLFLVPSMLAQEFNDTIFLSYPSLLSYYGTFIGSLLGAAATIFAVALTINHNEKISSQNLYEIVKPYLNSTCFKQEERDLFDPNNIYINIDLDNGKGCRRYSPYPFEKEHDERFTFNEHLTPNQMIIEYVLKNVGNGPAINITFELKVDFLIHFYPISKIAIPQNESQKIIFFFYSDKIENLKTIEKYLNIKIIYSDIYQNNFFCQIDEFWFLCDHANRLALKRPLLLSAPHKLDGYKVTDLPLQD